MKDAAVPADTPPAQPAGIRIHALGGEAAPRELGTDLRRMKELPARAKQELWKALGPSLAQPVPVEAERALDDFCSRHELDEDLVAAIVRASRFLVREAAQRELDPKRLGDDVMTLSGDQEVRAILLAGYDKARRVLREEISKMALVPHGDTVEDVVWRLDRVLGTSDQADVDVLVAHLTLTVRRGAAVQQLPLQLDLAGVRALRLACEAVEQRAARARP